MSDNDSQGEPQELDLSNVRAGPGAGLRAMESVGAAAYKPVVEELTLSPAAAPAV